MLSILYATDFSTPSIGALNYAYGLKEKFKTELLISHIGGITQFVKNPYIKNKGDYKSMERAYYHYSNNKLREFVSNNLSENATDIDTYHKVHNDISPDMGIISMAKAYASDLIITGLNGNNLSPSKDLYIGTNVKSLINRAPSPVIAVPPIPTETSSVKNIYFLSNFETGEIGAIQKLIQCAEKWNASITILKVNTNNDAEIKNNCNSFKEKLTAVLNYPSWSIKVIIANNTQEGLNYITNHEKVDLLSFYENLPNHWVDKLFHKVFVKTKRNYKQIPLLAFNKKNIKRLHKKPTYVSHTKKITYSSRFYS